MRFSVLVEVRPKPGVADPQGATIERSLPALGFEEIEGVRVGKAIRFSLDAPGAQEASERVADLCKRLLANPVIEEAQVSLAVEEGSAGRL